MHTRRASVASSAVVVGIVWVSACAETASPNPSDDRVYLADASPQLVDGPTEVVIDAAGGNNAAPDARSDGAIWCDALSADAGVKQVLFCADFDDGNFSRVGEGFLQWSTNASLQIANTVFQSPPSSMTVKTAPAVKKDAAAPGLDVDASFARIAGHAEPVFRDAEVDLSFRMTSPFNAEPGAEQTELAAVQFGWFNVWLRLAPTGSGQGRLSMHVLSEWTGPVPDAATLGFNDQVLKDVDIATAPIGIGEWIECKLRVSFTPQPAGDASAHIEIDLKRNAAWSNCLTYDYPSTRFRSYVFYMFGVNTYVTTGATSFDYDNLAVFVR